MVLSPSVDKGQQYGFCSPASHYPLGVHIPGKCFKSLLSHLENGEY